MLSIFAGDLSPDMRQDNLRERYARRETVNLLEGNLKRPAAWRNAGGSRR